MKIQRLRINGWDVADCNNIVDFTVPTAAFPMWYFDYENGDRIYATGAVSFLLKDENEKSS